MQTIYELIQRRHELSRLDTPLGINVIWSPHPRMKKRKYDTKLMLQQAQRIRKAERAIYLGSQSAWEMEATQLRAQTRE